MSVDRDLPVAVVFDCDGTLVDSERVSADAMETSLEELGHELTADDLASLVGHTWVDNQRYFRQRWDMTERELQRYIARYRELARPRFADDELVFDDVREVVGQLHDAGVPMAVCTSSTLDHVTTVTGLTPLRDRFDVVVAFEDTDRHKPDPAPYEEAVARLEERHGVRLERSSVTVVEDSIAGVTSALAAGCWTVAIDRGAQLHDVAAADVIVDRLTVPALVPRRRTRAAG